MKKFLIACCSIVLAIQGAQAAHAAEPSLRMQPLQYTETLQKGERKQGFIDITNTQPEAVDVALSVQGFRQVDNKGTLEFYDDERLRDGIQLDLKDAQIPARKTLRLFFVADSTKLPAGDVFAAIFAKTMATKASGADMSVRLGSLLILTNGSPSEHKAVISKLTIPQLQYDQDLTGELKITNTASREASSGFFPEITLHVWPFSRTVTFKGPLVYAGNTRTVPFELAGNYFGVYKIIVSHGTSQRTGWVVAVTGVWRWLAPVLAIIFIVSGAGLIRYFQGRKKFVRKG